MQPSEEEMSRIINDVYWEAAKRLREDPQGTYQGPWSDKAAHAIMEKWDKGVVWSEPMVGITAGSGDEELTEFQGPSGTLRIPKWVLTDEEHGQEFRVTVRLEGEDGQRPVA